MAETIKLYDRNAYDTEFEAVVLSCEKAGDNRYQVVLDQTLFFPEEGGQTPDKGKLGEGNVTDVQIKKGIIIHTVDTPLEEGKKVSGCIDWEHRFSNMQQHSGEHIFSGIVHTMYGYDNVGFHLSDSVVTMDFNGVLSDTAIAEIEYKVNEAIIKNISIEVTFPSKEELAVLDYRSKIEIDGAVRIVTIPGYDVCACCAPHVAKTGEIGMLKVIGTQNYKGGVRVSILCGFRALKDYRAKADTVGKISNLLSAKTELVYEAVEKLRSDSNCLKQELNKAKKEVLFNKLSRIPENAENVLLYEENADMDIVREAVNVLMEKHSGYCGIFSGDDTQGYRYIIGSANKDTRIIGNVLKEKCNGKGGGKPEMIQGSVSAARADIEAAVQSIIL